jgi:hypothetical protein
MLKILLPTLAAAVLVTSGCSSKSNDNSSSNGNPPATTKGTNTGDAMPECPTAAKINAALGLGVNEPTVNGTGAVRVCMYTPAPGKSGNAIVRFQGKNDAAQFAAAKAIFKNSGQPMADMSGVGDEAYSSTLSAGNVVNNTIVARKGSLEILVTSHASLDQEKVFINGLFG